MIQRALLLLQQSRYDVAEAELRRLLAKDPNDAQIHALLSWSLAEQDRLQEAEAAARQAVRLAPDESFTHYHLGLVKAQMGDLRTARQAVAEALRLDPERSDYYALQALVYLQGERWQEALDAANEGLTHDPTHQGCLNHRAAALVKLNRHEEAHQTIGEALQKDPENEYTHANLGWAYLHQGQHQQALEHFSEALRLDPNFDYARQGLVEALKARYLLYRCLLRFFLWMSTLSPRVRGGLVVGAYIISKALQGVARQNPKLAPFIIPIVGSYLLFVLLTWTVEPLFNLVLQCNRYGRYALSKKQRWSSSLFGLLLLGAIVVVACGALTGWVPFYLLAAHLGILIIPATHILADDGAIDAKAFTFVVFMVLVAAAAVAFLALGYKEVTIACTILNVLGLAVFTWFGALLGLRRPQV